VTETPVEDVPQRTLGDILSEIINHLDLNPAHRLDLLGAVEGAVGNANRPAGHRPTDGKLAIPGGLLPFATSGTVYTADVRAHGGTEPVTYSAAGLPAGLSLSPAGQVTGKTTVTGTWPVTVTATDSSSPPQVVTAVLSLVVV